MQSDNIEEIFKGDYVTAENLGQDETLLTVAAAFWDDVYAPHLGRKARSVVLSFKERDQALVMNKTRAFQMSKDLKGGRHFLKWVGIVVQLGIGQDSRGKDMVICLKPEAQPPAAPQANVTSAGQQPTTASNPTAEAYKGALNQALKASIPTRHVDIGEVSKGQLSFYRNELLQSMAVSKGGTPEMKGGAVLPYVARVYVMKMAGAGASIGGSTEQAEEQAAIAMEAAIVQAGAEAGHVSPAIEWLCKDSADGVVDVHIDAILALIGLEGINVKTTFDWLAKTAGDSVDN